MKHLIAGKTYNMVLQKDLFSAHYHSIYIYFFYILEDLDIASYADDTAIYTVKEKKESVINTLEATSLSLFTWFNNNFLKANSDKSHLLLSCSEPSTALIDGSSVESNTKEIQLTDV